MRRLEWIVRLDVTSQKVRVIFGITAIGKDNYFTSASNALTRYAIGLDSKWLDAYVQQLSLPMAFQ